MTAPALIARRTADVRTELSSLKGGAPLPAPPERDARVRMLSLADFTWMIRELRALRSVARRHSLTEAWPMYLDQRADLLPSIDLGNLMLSTRRSAVFRTALATCALRYERPDLESLWAPAGPAPQVETIDFVQIGSSADIREGRAKRVEAFGRKIALFRHEGEVCALNDTCPHRGGPLGKGDVEDGAVLCPLHGWAFDLRTGMMRGNERVRVDTYDVVETDGVVTLKLRGSPR